MQYTSQKSLKDLKEDSALIDCLFINPPFKFKVDSVWRGQRSEDPPLPLMALAAYVRNFSYSVRIVDCDLVSPSIDDDFEIYFIEEFVSKNVEIRTFGLTTTTLTIYNAFKIAEICKKYYPDSLVVFGGAHASFLPDESIMDKNVDVVVVGEGEYTLKEILDGKPLDLIKGIVFNQKNIDGRNLTIRNKPRERERDLDTFPYMAYDLIDVQKYQPILGSFKRLPAMMMVSSRGCPYQCSFCRRPVGNLYVARSANHIFGEIEYMVQTYGVKDVLFMDDMFTINRDNVMKLCDLLIESKIHIKWLCFARVDVVDQEMLYKMQEAGCWQIMYGVENFNLGVLENLKKGINREQIFDAMKWTKKAKIETRVCMMVGNPGETREIVMENIKLVKELDPDLLVTNILTPFPGHDIYNWAKSKDLITSFNWDDYYGAKPLLKLDHLRPEEIMELYERMIKSFYFRPSYIIKKIINIRSYLEFKLLLSGFLGILAFAFARMKKVPACFNVKGKKEEVILNEAKTKALQLDSPTLRTSYS